MQEALARIEARKAEAEAKRKAATSRMSRIATPGRRDPGTPRMDSRRGFLS